MLRLAGHEIIDYSYTSDFFELNNLGWKIRILKFPRRFLLKIEQNFAVRLLRGFPLLVLVR